MEKRLSGADHVTPSPSRTRHHLHLIRPLRQANEASRKVKHMAVMETVRAVRKWARSRDWNPPGHHHNYSLYCLHVLTCL